MSHQSGCIQWMRLIMIMGDVRFVPWVWEAVGQ